MNFATNSKLLAVKDFVSSVPLVTVVLPLGACFFIESKMNRLYKFGKVHVMISNCLTAMVGVYFFI
jgi:hypothetical protein